MAIQDAFLQDVQFDPSSVPAPVVQVQENKAKWRMFLDNLNDPAIRQGVIATGIGLMRSPGYGQNAGDVIGSALQSGVNTTAGLRNMEYERKTKEQERQDKLTQQGVQNKQGERQLDISSRNVDINAQNAQTNQNNVNMDAAARNAQLSEGARHNQATEETDRIRAEADRKRAEAYSSVGTRTPQDIQKINMMSQYYMQNEGLDEVSARAKAVMYVESTGAGKSPGENAMTLYQNKVKNWQADLNNFGKSLTPQQLQQMQVEAMDEVIKFSNLTAQMTNQPQTANPNKPNAGVIDRPASPVGTVRNGYKKIKAGPDNDKTTWEQVKTNGNPK